ncbi:hypothetical protein DCS_03654 [Drechmeria coniospora]|uniref:AAR2 domain containing protein n=1 Tax=Drechmeria coniospora TaxID=98403 RepID=A0A151GHZ1_DRECN|nr:hypothetical protein DCS_03654 [Drechmeria coniospora]KYK56652.1 hypothetical protein DCS_03654 [Drechmeria coniospora]
MSSSLDPRTVTQPDSTASAGGRSTKSSDSTKDVGGYPVGSLHIVRPDDDDNDDADDDDGPPPLEPLPSSSKQKQPARSMQPESPSNAMMHSMGGGDIVIVLHLPEAYTVGYDAVSFTAKTFVGIRHVPPGPHFFWAAHPDGASSRCGFWIMSSGIDRVHVMQWHGYDEVFVQPTRTDTRLQAENVDKIYPHLPSYRDPSGSESGVGALDPSKADANRHIWHQLSAAITQPVLDRIAGDPDVGWNLHTCDRVRGSLRLPSEMDLDSSLPHSVFHSHELRFSFQQGTRTYKVTSMGHDRTVNATDTSSHILARLDSQSDRLASDDIVGEFQFAYVVGMYLGNDSCIQQWWYLLLHLFLKAYRLALEQPDLAAALIRTLTAQLAHSTRWLEGSILDYSETHTHDLRIALIIYKQRLDELLGERGKESVTPGQIAVGNAFARLEGVLMKELDWDLTATYPRKGKVMTDDGEEIDLELDEMEAENDRGEWAPEIVELDDNGRQVGLVSWSD